MRLFVGSGDKTPRVDGLRWGRDMVAIMYSGPFPRGVSRSVARDISESVHGKVLRLVSRLVSGTISGLDYGNSVGSWSSCFELAR